MRIRPFFWCLLAAVCIGVLCFAANVRTHVPATMQVRIDQQSPLARGVTTLELHLSDSQGLPIDQALVTPKAWMTNMVMGTHHVSVKGLGQGNYLAQLQLNMAGPWRISIIAQADGFDSLTQTLLLQVE